MIIARPTRRATLRAVAAVPTGQFGPDRYAIDRPPEAAGQGRIERIARCQRRCAVQLRPRSAQPACCKAAVWLKARSIALNTWLGENGFAIKPSGRAACARCRMSPIDQPGQEDRRYASSVAQQAGQLDAVDRPVQPDIDKRQRRAGLGGERPAPPAPRRRCRRRETRIRRAPRRYSWRSAPRPRRSGC